MNICVGIISYFPDDNSLRHQKICDLVRRCDELFGIPIIIVAQNWGAIDMPTLTNSPMHIYKYRNKLGITEARRKLREHFLASSFDYIIMLDDDAVIKGTKEQAKNYIDKIQAHPDGFGVYNSLILKLFAVSKSIYSKFELPPGDISNLDYFEDMYIIMGMSKLFPDKKFCFDSTCLSNRTDPSEWDQSTWAPKGIDRHVIGDRTREMVKELR